MARLNKDIVIKSKAQGSDDFVRHVLELLSALGSIGARRMFGGHGIYCDGLMFALIADQALYFKCDEATRAQFEAAGCSPFVYSSKSRKITLSYWSAPEESLESPALALPWGRLALAAALRQSAAPARRRRASTSRARPGALTKKK